MESLTFWSKTVVCLYISTSVLPDTVTTLLHLCPHLRKLNLRAGGNSFCHFQTILSALNDLTHLRDLSLDPALLFGTRYVYLPDAAIFHRLTHLDLTTTWTWEAITTGFHVVPRLTHLSVSWGSSHTSRDSLHKLLSHDKVKLIVIWREGTETHNVVIENLLRHKLDDLRIVVLGQVGRSSLQMSGGYWLHAECIIGWHKKHSSEYHFVYVLKMKLTF